MPFNPFATPSNYKELLNKLGWFSFFSNVILFFLFSNFVFDAYSKLPIKILSNRFPIFDVSFYLGNVTIAFMIALLSHIFRLHDFLAKIFSIRENYEMNHIILPIVANSNVGINLETIKNSHKNIMSVFYDNLININNHYPDMFWDKIFWYWMFIELVLYSFIISSLCFFVEEYKSGYVFLLLSFVLILVSHFLRNRAAVATEKEVLAILSDSNCLSLIDIELKKIK